MRRLVRYGATFVAGLVAGGAALVGLRSRDDETESPAGPEQLLEGFDNPVFVLDDGGAVLHANGACRGWFDTEHVVGRQLEDALASHPALRDAVAEGVTDTVEFDTADGPRHVDVCVGDRCGRRRVVSLHDVTGRRERQSRLDTRTEQLAALEAQNERLDRFASVISHDLRNPLDVAKGRTTAVEEMLDDPELEAHLAGAQDAHDRMQRIISDVLTLARKGENVGETAYVPLETAATDAWSHVDTADATLTVDTQLVVEADADRLTQILENLFRNAVTHGGDDVAVRVAHLPGDDGFTISDDGPGIPPEERERILEAGYSSDGSGTGLGLAIVSSIADAHGWSVRVTEASAGGARFEFSDVGTVTGELPAQTVK
ncbi:MAG: ATP-binding protein [Halovenus sp.]